MRWPVTYTPFDKALNDETPGQEKLPRNQYSDRGSLPVVDQGQKLIGGYCDNNALGYSGPLPIIVFGDHTLALKYVDFPFVLGADGVRILSAKVPFEPKYLFYYLQSVKLQSHGYARHFKLVRELQFPVAALMEQRRIVELLEQADALRSRRADADARGARILPSCFRKIFGDPCRNDRGWRTAPLGSFLNGIESGWSPNCENRPVRSNEWGVLKLGAVTTNTYLDAENKALPTTLKPEPQLEVKEGDLLFGRKNTFQLVGACAFVFKTRSKLMLSDLIFRLCICEGAELHPLYLWGLLTYPSKRPAIQALASGSAGSMPNISKGRLETLTIEAPPLRLQAQFADCVRRINDIHSEAEACVEKIETLFQTLLHRAFAGELTAGWREAHMKELLAEMEIQARHLASAQA